MTNGRRFYMVNTAKARIYGLRRNKMESKIIMCKVILMKEQMRE